MSNSVRLHRRQPSRLPCSWDSPGKNTGVGCHFLLQCMKVKSESEVAQLCLTLRDPMDCSLPGSSVHGIFQARVRSAVPLPSPKYITVIIKKYMWFSVRHLALVLEVIFLRAGPLCASFTQWFFKSLTDTTFSKYLSNRSILVTRNH